MTDVLSNDKCGTYAGHQRHKVKLEEPCRPCRDAAAAYMREFRKRKAYARRRGNLQTAAYAAAERALRMRHQPEFDALYDRELRVRGLYS